MISCQVTLPDLNEVMKELSVFPTDNKLFKLVLLEVTPLPVPFISVLAEGVVYGVEYPIPELVVFPPLPDVTLELDDVIPPLTVLGASVEFATFPELVVFGATVELGDISPPVTVLGASVEFAPATG